MKRLLSVCVILVTSNAFAEEAKPPIPATEMTYKGELGTWFHQVSVRRILKTEEDLQSCRAAESVHQERVENLKLQVKTTEQISALNAEIAETRLKQLQWEHDERVRLESRKDKWYKSQTLWFSVGLVLGVSTVAVTK